MLVSYYSREVATDARWGTGRRRSCTAFILQTSAFALRGGAIEAIAIEDIYMNSYVNVYIISDVHHVNEQRTERDRVVE